MHRPMYRYCLLMSGLLALRSYSAFLAVDSGNTSVTQDGSAAHPSASLAAAAFAAKPGDTVRAAAGIPPIFRRRVAQQKAAPFLAGAFTLSGRRRLFKASTTE